MKKRSILLMIFTMFFTILNVNGCSSSSNTYTFIVKSIGGKLLNDVTVELYKGNKLLKSTSTNDNGEATIKIDAGDYEVKLTDLPNGYYVNNNFPIFANNTSYKLEVLSFVANGELQKGTTYQLADIINDFTIKNSEEEEITLSSYLQEHSAVVINFWFSNCTWCLKEFPYMEEAYQQYQDDIAIIALNYMPNEIANGLEFVADFKYDQGLNFDLGFDTIGLFNMFGFSGAPSTAIIDRYGIISYIEEGAITSTEKWVDLFEKFIGDDYYPITNTEGGINSDKIPNVSMPDSSLIESTINGEGFTATYKPETEEENLQFAWPFILSDDGTAIQNSNAKLDSTSSIIHTTITLQENEVFAFDYTSSTEINCDILYVLIDGQIIQEISGIINDWTTCYAYVSEEIKTYDVTFIYLKDYSDYEGEDIVKIKNLRIVNTSDINTPTFIYRQCSSNFNETTNSYNKYVSTFFNQEDGYYHVGSVNGPLVMADLLYPTNWSTETLYNLASENLCIINGIDYNKVITDYASYASNGSNGYTPVTQELYEALNAITKSIKQTSNENTWLEVCCYFSAYGTNGKELEDPIKGLSTFSSFTAVEGDQNFCTFDKPILPRGYKFKFIPEKSGVYKIYGLSDTETIGWIFNENDELVYESNFEARYLRIQEDTKNFEIYYYFEKDTTYYICPAFYDLLHYGTLQFSIDYIGETYDLFTLCAPGYFTTESVDEDGNMIGNLIALERVQVQLSEEDGYYHALNEDGSLGSIIYCDFFYGTTLFSNANGDALSLNDMITLGAFNFTLDSEGNKLIGKENLTPKAREYVANAITEEGDLYGCVPVDAQLADMLQQLMDKYSFKGVKNSWLKLCYYYDYLGQ